MRSAVLEKLWTYRASSATRLSDVNNLPSLNEKINRVPNVYIGTYFEERCMKLLNSDKYGFHLARVGGPNDRGIDLKGIWNIPRMHEISEPVTVNIVGQCKHFESDKKRLSVNIVREFEGTMTRIVDIGVVGLLISSGGFTEPAQEIIHSSKFPLVAMSICFPTDIADIKHHSNGFIRELLMNPTFLSKYPAVTSSTELLRISGSVVASKHFCLIK